MVRGEIVDRHHACVTPTLLNVFQTEPHVTRLLAILVVGCSLLFTPLRAFAQDDAALRLAEPDYTLVALPTALNVPFLKTAFRVTHRFTRPLDCEECPNSLA